MSSYMTPKNVHQTIDSSKKKKTKFLQKELVK